MRGRPNSARAALIGAACLVLAAALVLPAAAGADLLTPEAGPTENAVKTDTLYKIVLVHRPGGDRPRVGGPLLHAVPLPRAARSRRRPRSPATPPLELGWTIGAGAIVVAITIITYIFLPDIRDPAASGPASVAEARGQYAAVNQPPPPGGKALEIQVSGQQYLWRYQYPNQARVSSTRWWCPATQTVMLTIKANDVVHSWWIPELGGKLDAVPGYTNETWFKATRNGVVRGPVRRALWRQPPLRDDGEGPGRGSRGATRPGWRTRSG